MNIESLIQTETFKYGKQYSIVQDDNDGDMSEINRLDILLRTDSDIFITTNSDKYLRFREPWIGGGMYPETYQALRNLIQAIEKDRNNIMNGIR